jgi:aspartyl/asparaginyl beta-hydroxylase (cupin superfamily)
MMLFVLCLIIITLIIVVIWTHPHLVLQPINAILRSDCCTRTAFYSRDELQQIFPAHTVLQQHWLDIRDDGHRLYNNLQDKSVNYLNNYNIDLGSEDKKEWTTIPLRLFGVDSNVSCALRPFLDAHPEIKSCMYSIMQPGKIIQEHVGPYDGLIRYQLALDIPDGECYLHVSGQRYYWQNGHDVLFDESNVHGAVNNSDKPRMVLLIDIERPYCSIWRTISNKIIVYFMSLLPSTTNATVLVEEDEARKPTLFIVDLREESIQGTSPLN